MEQHQKIVEKVTITHEQPTTKPKQIYSYTEKTSAVTNTNKNPVPNPFVSSVHNQNTAQKYSTNNQCSCNSDNSQKTSSHSSATYTTPSGLGGQANFGGILSSMSLLQQLPVLPQVPGYPISYAPDKIPKGAVIAFMPVVILPEAAYANCNEDAKHQQQLGSLGLGVQPSSIPASFSLNSLFGGQTQQDQCMCPCSCSQNLPERVHKKRDANEDDVPEPLKEVDTATEMAKKSAEESVVPESKADAAETQNAVETTKLESVTLAVEEKESKTNDAAKSTATTSASDEPVQSDHSKHPDVVDEDADKKAQSN